MKTIARPVDRNDRIKEFLSSLNIDIDFNYLDYDNIEDYSDLYTELDNNCLFQVEINYYSEAMIYLSNNDPSLMGSLKLAADLGYSIENLNSGVLASLLETKDLIEEFTSKKVEIDEFFDSLTKE